MDLNYQRMIIGYHGCDAAVVVKVLSGEEALAPSERDYDWLRPGIYFWEHGPQRAYDWAEEEKQRDPDKIQVPAVLGAYINFGQCFDLLDTANTKLLQDVYPEFRRLTLESDRPKPENKAVPGLANPDKVLRYLDCAMIKFSLEQFPLDVVSRVQAAWTWNSALSIRPAWPPASTTPWIGCCCGMPRAR